MNSRAAVLMGSQEPRVANCPKYHWTHADDAAFLASSYGLTPDPWQHTVLESWLGEKRDGRWAAGTCGLAVPRQNGKNGALEVRELYGMVALGEKFLHTAHEVKTARKAFLRLCSFFENERKFPELAALVTEIRKTNGQEAIALANGGSVEFVARSRGSGRGYTVDVLVCDEAQELSDEQLEALMPTISAAPTQNPQVVLTGTPPGPGSVGEVWSRTRATGVAATDKRLSWIEWSIEGVADVTDRDLWAATNPALGTRLSTSVIEDELALMSEDGFARERLGRWDSDGSRALIAGAEWSPLKMDEPPIDGDVAYGVKFSLDGSMVALAAALRHEDDPIHVELVQYRLMSEGTAWLVEWLEQRARASLGIVIDGKAHAGALVNDLRLAKVPAPVIVTPTTQDVVAAHAMVPDAVREGRISHFDQQPLNDAVAHAIKRPIGNAGGWGWQSLSEAVDVLPLEAVTLAHYGAKTSKRKPGRKSRVTVMA